MHVCVCECVLKWEECAAEKWELSVNLMRPTFSVRTHTYTQRAPSGQWKCHIIGFPFQDNRHAHWIRSDHRRQFCLCLPLSAFPSVFCFFFCLFFCISLFFLSFLSLFIFPSSPSSSVYLYVSFFICFSSVLPTVVLISLSFPHPPTHWFFMP